jgi:hypothetical protein
MVSSRQRTIHELVDLLAAVEPRRGARARLETGLHSLVLHALIRFGESGGARPDAIFIGNQRSTILMRSSLRSLHSLRSFAQLARFISRAPDTHAFRQVDVAQAALVASWRALLQSGQILPFDTVGFQTYSENEEDGILLYIFTVAGTINKIVVEISSQDGRICMASNLIIHHRWCGFLFDGDSSFVTNGRRFFGRHPATRSFPPTFETRWFDRHNVVPSEIDLLSLDVDGNDLYIWDALSVTRERQAASTRQGTGRPSQACQTK